MKSPSFQALVLVKFRSRYARDLAVGILQKARSKHGAKNRGGHARLASPNQSTEIVPYAFRVYCNITFSRHRNFFI